MKFSPTYLYIKQHSVTGLLYFGKTTKSDPNKYLGSGKHWTRHIKKHGREYVVTLWAELFTDRNELMKFAAEFSTAMNITESKSWANLVDENGIDGAPKNHKRGMTGKNHSDKTKQTLRTHHIGKCKSDEHRAAISKASQNRSETHRQNLIAARRRRSERERLLKLDGKSSQATCATFLCHA